MLGLKSSEVTSVLPGERHRQPGLMNKMGCKLGTLNQLKTIADLFVLGAWVLFFFFFSTADPSFLLLDFD